MSTQCHGGVYTFSCDSCPEVFAIDDSDLDVDNAVFEEVWNAAKANGWVAFKHKDEWHHMCNTCAKED